MLARLAGQLVRGDGSVWVHVDRRTDVAPFITAVGSLPRVRFVPDHLRVRVYWSGFSMVEAALQLLRCAAAQQEVDRFVLLSGSDYPIKTWSELSRTLDQEVDYVQVDRRLDPGGTTPWDEFVRNCFLGDNRVLNPRSSVPKLPQWSRKLEKVLRRRPPRGIEIHHGPAWWALRRPAVEYVLAFITQQPSTAAWFRLGRAPDEMFFHTILRSRGERFPLTTLCDRPLDATRSARNVQSLHYVDWSSGNPDLPRTLTLSDLDAVSASAAMFARKMDSQASRLLLDRIDQEILA